MGSLCGSCKWCLLLLVGWCGGFCGVRVSEAMAAYVVLVHILGKTDTIYQTELTGIAATLTKKRMEFTRDSACSLSQIRKQLLFPEMQQAHTHSSLLEQIVSMIRASPEPLCFYEVKVHSGIVGNECTDAIAKHFAYTTMVMTCTFSLRLQTVMHTHTSTGLRLKTLRSPVEEEGLTMIKISVQEGKTCSKSSL